jgi:hypothetical protein
MKAFIVGTTFALAASVGLAAQSSTVKSKTKVDVKDGKDVVVTGCVKPSTSRPGYILTDVESRQPATSVYLLVGEEDALSKHVGHLVEIKGKATNIGDDAKVEVTTETKVDREHADDSTTKSKTQIEGQTAMPYLGVKSVKMLRETCS